MKKIGYTLGVGALATLPLVSLAQFADPAGASGGNFGGLLSNIITFTNTVLIPFILGIGFLVFVWGIFQYFIAGGANDEKKEKGRSLMIYAILGFVFIIVFWGVINLIADSTGLNEDLTTKIPQVTPI